jgi:hypothetical protein
VQKAESPAKSGSQDDSNDQVNAGCDRKRAKNKPQRQISVSVFIRALSMNRRNSKAINQAVDKEQERKEKEEDMLILGLTAPTTSHSRKTWIIYPNDRFKEMFWDVIISIILLLTCFMTPINLAFGDEVDKIEWYSDFNMIIDLLFFADIIVNFNSAYQDDLLQMVDDRKVIAMKYLTGWFFIDLVAILPFNQLIDLITLNDNFDSSSTSNQNEFIRITRISKLYKLIKITRLFRLFKFA